MLTDGMCRTEISFAPQLEDPALCNGRINKAVPKQGEILKRVEIGEINLDIMKSGAQSGIKYSLLRARHHG